VHIASYFASEQVLFFEAALRWARFASASARRSLQRPRPLLGPSSLSFSTAVLISGVISVQKAVDLRRAWATAVVARYGHGPCDHASCLLLFIYPSRSPRTFTIFIGLSLIYAGVSDLVIVLLGVLFQRRP
jgi:hypothetical protein